MIQSDLAQPGLFASAYPLLGPEQLAALPDFDGTVPKYEANLTRLAMTGTAKYRLYAPWHPTEEWFVLKHSKTVGQLLCLYRRGRDVKQDRIVGSWLPALEGVRGPNGRTLKLDAGFVPVPLTSLYRG